MMLSAVHQRTERILFVRPRRGENRGPAVDLYLYLNPANERRLRDLPRAMTGAFPRELLSLLTIGSDYFALSILTYKQQSGSGCSF